MYFICGQALINTPYSKIAVILVFFCLLTNEPFLKENILLNFEIKNEATRANLQVSKRALKWWSFWNKLYSFNWPGWIVDRLSAKISIKCWLRCRSSVSLNTWLQVFLVHMLRWCNLTNFYFTIILQECSYLHHLNGSENRCHFVKSNKSCEMSEGFIQYIKIPYCSFPTNLVPLAFFLLVC